MLFGFALHGFWLAFQTSLVSVGWGSGLGIGDRMRDFAVFAVMLGEAMVRKLHAHLKSETLLAGLVGACRKTKHDACEWNLQTENDIENGPGRFVRRTRQQVGAL